MKPVAIFNRKQMAVANCLVNDKPGCSAINNAMKCMKLSDISSLLNAVLGVAAEIFYLINKHILLPTGIMKPGVSAG